MKVAITILLLAISSFSFSQVVTCNHLRDSVNLSNDTIYINQPTDTIVNLGVQWMGFNDLSYTSFHLDYNDSSNISLKGGTVSGGLFSPYPNPVLFSVNIDYLNQSIPTKTVINTSIEVFGPNVNDTNCSVPITFIINPLQVSVSKIRFTELNAKVFPNPLTISSTIEISDEMKFGYNVIIYDVLGKEIYRTKKLNSNTHLLKRSIFKSSGVYFVEIKSINMKSELIKLLVK